MKRLIQTPFQQSLQTPPEPFNRVFWEIILTWMHRGATWKSAANPSQRDGCLILKTHCNKQKQEDRNPSFKTGVQLVSHSLWPPWSAGPQTPSQGNVFQMELFKTENTENCLLKIQSATQIFCSLSLNKQKHNAFRCDNSCALCTV